MLRRKLTLLAAAAGLVAALLAAPRPASAQRTSRRHPSQLRAGDHLRVRKLGVWHHGIYTGNGKVVHRDNLVAAGHVGVRETSLRTFSHGAQIEVVHNSTRSRDHIVRSARDAARRRDRSYDPFFNNCEHEANKHATGKATSTQVKTASLPMLAAAAGLHMMMTPLRTMAGALQGK